MAVQECDCCGCSLVNLSHVGQAWIVSGHVLEHQVGVAQDDGDVVLQRVLELGRVTHGDHRSIWNDRSRASQAACRQRPENRTAASATHAIGRSADLTIGVCLTWRVRTHDVR